MKKTITERVPKFVDITITRYHCMVTYNGKDDYEAWLTHNDMTDMIRNFNSPYDYYTLGDKKECVVGRKTVYETVTREIEVDEVKEMNDFFASIDWYADSSF